MTKKKTKRVYFILMYSSLSALPFYKSGFLTYIISFSLDIFKYFLQGKSTGDTFPQFLLVWEFFFLLFF